MGSFVDWLFQTLFPSSLWLFSYISMAVPTFISLQLAKQFVIKHERCEKEESIGLAYRIQYNSLYLDSMVFICFNLIPNVDFSTIRENVCLV